MSLDEVLKRVDEQIAAQRAVKPGNRRQRERRTQAVPVLVEQRKGERRQGDRRAKGRG